MARTYRLERVQEIARPLDEVFTFFSDAANLQALTPRFLNFSIETPLPVAMRAGANIKYRLGLFGVPMGWLTVITAWDPPSLDEKTGRRVARFIDQQVSGPYAVWKHLHEFEEIDGRTVMRDVVDYAVPFGLVGEIARWAFVSRTLDRIFAYRYAATEHIFDAFPAPASPSVLRVGFEIVGEIAAEIVGGVRRVGELAASELRRVETVAPIKPTSPGAPSDYDVEVYFDGDCPLCIREIKLLRWLDDAKRIRFTDIAAPDFNPETTGLTKVELMDKIHGRMSDGSRIEGVEVFRQLYGAVGFKRAVAVSRWPGVAHLLHLGYVLFAKNRLRMTGRCIDDVCEVPARPVDGTRPRPEAFVGAPDMARPTGVHDQAARDLDGVRRVPNAGFAAVGAV